jgi:anthranilate synthase component II
MKVLIIDNYDSFTYNLFHYIQKYPGVNVEVFRNDKIQLEEIAKFDKIVLSPGPGIPDEAGISKDLIAEYAPCKSILGVCLGHQAIAEVFGGTLHNMERVYHGVASNIIIEDREEPLFKGLPVQIEGGRYHSWLVQRDNLPKELIITATNEQNEIMALRHQTYDVKGLQFHPESVLTNTGETIINNWLSHE